MLRDYRCQRYSTRLKELAHCVHWNRPIDEGVIAFLASSYADRYQPTLGERFASSEAGEWTAVAGSPAPTSVWEEDAELLHDFLRYYHVHPTPDMALNLYTATLCRHAGMSQCEESRVAQRRALPIGMSLGDLMVRFMFLAEERNVASA